jgi:hypothetical protein
MATVGEFAPLAMFAIRSAVKLAPSSGAAYVDIAHGPALNLSLPDFDRSRCPRAGELLAGARSSQQRNSSRVLLIVQQ